MFLEFRKSEDRKQNRRNNQENFLGFSEYLAQHQKYWLQFKLESLSFQCYLMLGTIHTWLKYIVENFPCFLMRFFNFSTFSRFKQWHITIVNYLVNCDFLGTDKLLVTHVHVSMANMLLSGLFWKKRNLWTLLVWVGYRMAEAEPFLAGELHLISKLLESVFIYNLIMAFPQLGGVILFYTLSVLNLIIVEFLKELWETIALGTLPTLIEKTWLKSLSLQK